MGDMYKVKERLCEELEDLMSKRPWTPGDLEQVKMLTASIHYVDESMEIEQEEEYGGYSGRRGRGANASRDSMGRYSSARGGGSGGNQGGGGGYSGRYPMDNYMYPHYSYDDHDDVDERLKNIEQMVRNMQSSGMRN